MNHVPAVLDIMSDTKEPSNNTITMQLKTQLEWTKLSKLMRKRPNRNLKATRVLRHITARERKLVMCDSCAACRTSILALQINNKNARLESTYACTDHFYLCIFVAASDSKSFNEH